MRANERLILVGPRVLLVPYRKEHVEQYHAWMQDPHIREATASEPLSLEEEYAMQASWHADDDKLTFIVMARPADSSGGVPESAAAAMQAAQMVGDVNLFLSEAHDDEEEEGAAPQPKRWCAEVEVMIAEHAFRGQGIAHEAVSLLLHYASQPSAGLGALPAPFPLPAHALHAKIGLANAGSRRLFARLGFEEVNVSQVWQEVEVRWSGEGATPPLARLEWPLQ